MKPIMDHVVIVVASLAEAMREYDAAGFRVTPGGRHDAIPTENALVPFEDGSYLELLALRDEEARRSLEIRAARPGWAAELRRGSAVGRRFFPRLAGAPGVADFALGVRDIGRMAAEIRRRGFPTSGPIEFNRERGDGVRLEMSLALPDSYRLPFFVEDHTARDLRVPDGDAARHPNGAIGIAAVRVRVSSVPEAALGYAGLFDAAPRPTGGGAELAIAGVRVALVPGEPEGADGVELRVRGAGRPAMPAHGVAISVEPAG